MHATELARIARATRIVEVEQKQLLAERFGTRERFRFDMAYHNLDHALDVAAGAEASVRLLVTDVRLPEWAPFAARLAGLFHDHVQDQGPGHNEDLSIDAAMDSLRRFAEFDEDFLQLVAEGIDATKVLEFDARDARIVQNADPGDEFRAAVADNDLGVLGLPGSTYQALGLLVEHQRDTLCRVEWSTLHDAHPDRSTGADWLLDQARVHENHEYLLDSSKHRFAHQQHNAGELHWLAECWAADEISWDDLVDIAKPLGVRLED